MAVKKGKKAKNKAKSLAAGALPQKRAGDVKGGCVSSAHYNTVTISMRKAGSDPQTSGKSF
jgi:hypothetical protein